MLFVSALVAVVCALAAGASDVTPRALPFAIGESLRYKLGWSTFAHAADVQLDFVERRDLFGQPTLHFRAALHSFPPLRALFPVDDVFDSYSDPQTFVSRQYEFHLSEMGSKEERIRRFTSSGAPRIGPGPHVVVPAGTRDPLGVLYEMRTLDWARTPEYRVPMYDGNDVFEARAQLQVKDELIAIDAGNFHAMRIDAHLYHHGAQVEKTELSMWFENGAARTPLLLEATMPYGKIRAELEPQGKK
jgi:hypothetical protein